MRLAKEIPTETRSAPLLTVPYPPAFEPLPRAVLDQTIPERLQIAARTFARRPALIAERETLRYDELQAKVNRLASRVLARLGPEQAQVAFLLSDRVQQIIAALAILQAGKAYVALDPSHPPERLEYILADSRASLVLTDGANRKLAEHLGHGEVLALQVDVDEGEPSSGYPVPALSPDLPATLLYTSGTTGTPKGVIQTHRTILHAHRSLTNRYAYCSDDVMPFLFSLSFAAHLVPMLGALLNGAALCPFDLKKEGAGRLVAWLREGRLTVYSSVPTLFRRLMALLEENEVLGAVRLVSMGGEPVYRRDVELFKQHFPRGAYLGVGLGGTETHTIRARILHHDSQVPPGVVAPGYPVEDKEVLLLDETGQPVPPGEVGEIVVRSRYISPGYWCRPDLTARVFRQDPEEPDVRLYFTGDLGRLQPDGCLEFLGRKDFQVKIRGHRVELAEVEAALAELPGVAAAAAWAAEDASGAERRLVAYLVPLEGAGTLEAARLRRSLAARLPDYMLPSQFVILDRLPLTATGKIDRKALPPPPPERPALEEGFVPAANEVERRLVQIWEEVLGISPVGVRDDYFDLGGDSLQAVELFAAMEKAFGIDLPLSTLLEERTIEGLARIVERQRGGRWDLLVAIQDDGSQHPPLFLVPGAGGDVLGFHGLAEHLPAQQPIYAFRSPGLDGRQRPLETVEAVAEVYLEALRARQPRGPYFLGGYSFGGLVAFEMACLLVERGERISLLALFDASAPGHKPKASVQPQDGRQARGRGWRWHLRAMAQEGPFGAARYVAGKARNRFTDLRRKVGRRARWRYRRLRRWTLALACRLLLRLGRPLPRAWRHRYVEDVNRRAGARYQGRPYPGSVVLFRRKGVHQDDFAGWGRLVQGGIDLVWVPVRNHLDLFKEPHVKELALEVQRRIRDMVRLEAETAVGG